MMSKKTKYIRVVNLTGTDYPVMTDKDIIKRLFDEEKEYIYGFNISKEKYISGSRRPPHKDKYIYYYVYDTNRYIRGLFNLLRFKRSKRYRFLKYDFYYGSEYWALTYNTLKKIIAKYNENSHLQKLLKHCFAPSESWIHTIYFNMDEHKGHEYNDHEHRELQMLSPVTYFDYRGKVKILNEGDYEDIVLSGKMFARKIISPGSDALIKKINILRNE